MFRKLTRKEFLKIRSFLKINWLIEKEESVYSMLREFDSNEEHAFLHKLLSDFLYIDNQTLGEGLKKMALKIVHDYGLQENTTQICAITYDDEADSSQKFLDYLKMPLGRLGWSYVKTVNAFGKIVKNFKKGYRSIIFVDEFIGSGQTVMNRVKQLNNDLGCKYDLKILYFAGMQYAIDMVRTQGYSIDCIYSLKKGITESFNEELINPMIELMLKMEKKLKDQINNFKLPDYSLGFNKAESLYSLENCQGNTPNSVFPVFWWPRNYNNEKRKVIVDRFERGLS